MHKLFFFILSIIVFFSLSTVDAADILSYKQIDLYRSILSFQQNITRTKLDWIMAELKGMKCEYVNDEKHRAYSIDAVCFLKWELPSLKLQEVTDVLWEDVIGFEEVYQLDATSFEYQATQPIYAGSSYDGVFKKDAINVMLLHKLAQRKVKISIPYSVLAREQAKNYSFYAVARNWLEKLGPCTRNNYNVALQVLDKVTLYPEQSYTINDFISWIDGFCTGTGPEIYKFYGWSCGASTHLFRVWLIHPNINIERRSSHNAWYTQYYADYIYGDDAAIYEDAKKLKIRNMWDVPIYFKVINEPDYTYLVAISPEKIDKSVVVNKKQTWELNATVTKLMYDEEGKLYEKWDWNSRYKTKL